MGINLENTIIVVDEAHNLPDRIRMNMERIVTPTIVRNSSMELEEYLGYLNVDYERNMSPTVAKEIEIVDWTFEVMKLARRKIADLFSKLHSNLGNDEEESIVQTSQLINVFNSACDEFEGISGQKKLGQEDIGGQISIDRSERIKKIYQVLNRVKIEVDSEDEEVTEPDSYRLGHILECIELFAETTALSLVFSNKGREGKITSHLLDPGIVSGKLFSSAKFLISEIAICPSEVPFPP